MSLPFMGETVQIKQRKSYIKMETNLFTIYFDGDQKLKFQTCSIKTCGICKISNNYKNHHDLKQYKVTSKNENC